MNNARNELWHHGVKGQKWGVRRYQNYDGTLTFQGRKRLGYKTPSIQESGDYKLNNYTSPGRQTAKRIAKRISNQILGSLIPGYALSLNVLNVDNIAKFKYDYTDYVKIEGEYEKLSEMKKKTYESSVAEDVKGANPRIGKQKGKVNNCSYCTVAIEMRRRGYDVQARSIGHGVNSEKVYSEIFDNFKIEHSQTIRAPKESRKDYINRGYNELCNSIEKYGNGARGFVGIKYEKLNSGHAMYWTVENNRVTFYDGQTGKKADDRTFALADPAHNRYARLDNLTVTNNAAVAVVSKNKN